MDDNRGLRHGRQATLRGGFMSAGTFGLILCVLRHSPQIIEVLTSTLVQMATLIRSVVTFGLPPREYKIR